MVESTHSGLFPTLPSLTSGGPPSGLTGHKKELALGMAAACVAALFVCVHWSIALVGAAATFVLSALEIEPFLLLIVFLLPVGGVLPADLPVRNVAIAVHCIVAAGFFLGRLWRGSVGVRRLLRPSLSLASLSFLGAVLTSDVLTQGGWTHDSARELYQTASVLGFSLVVLAWADSKQRIRKVLRTLLYSTGVTLSFAILQELVGGYTSLWFYLNPVDDTFQEWIGRASSFLDHPNTLAGYLNLMLPFALGCCAICEEKWKKLGGWIVGMGFVVMLCTQSLGGLVSFGCVLVLAILLLVGSWKKRVAILSGFLALVVVYYLGKGILNPSHEGTALIYNEAGRLLMWGVAWDLFVHSPILGVGWGNFKTLYGAYLGGSFPGMPEGGLAAHNVYLQLLAETGILGFTAFFSIIYIAAREAWRQWRTAVSALDQALAFGVLGAILSLLIHGLADVLFTCQFETLFWTLLALLVSNGGLERGVAKTVSQSAQHALGTAVP